MTDFREEPAYTPKDEFNCDGSTTHYQGCKCHEARHAHEVDQLKQRLAEAEKALEFYANGNEDLEPRPEKAHLYEQDYPMNSPEWLQRSMSDFRTGKSARAYFAKHAGKGDK